MSRKDIMLHRQFYYLRLTQLGILLLCICGFLYAFIRHDLAQWVQIIVIFFIGFVALGAWLRREWLLFVLSISSILINLDIELTPVWYFARIIVIVTLCALSVPNLELRFGNTFGLTLFPPGTGTIRPHSVGNVGRFLSLWELAFTMSWVKGGVFLGRPLPEHRLLGLFNFVKVGPKDDRHMLTIASARSGKGSAVIVPNLIHYPGSVIAIDPKGELATITASRRGFGSDKVKHCLKQKVYIFDPENIVRNHVGCCWNPLDELDLTDPLLWATIERISSVIIPLNDDPQASFFTNHARTLLTAIIAHVLECEAPERRNLIYVRKLIMEGDIEYYNLALQEGNHFSDPQEALLNFMSQNNAHGGKISRTAFSFQNKAVETKTSITATLEEQTGFLDHPGLEQYLQKSNLSLASIKQEPTTLYVCIKDTSLSTPLVKIMTLFVDLAIVALAGDITQKPKYNVLFVLDEFPTLGRSESIEKGMGLIAGYGITLWPIVQNISQLEALYPKSYKTFLTNTRGIQFFGALEDDNLKFIEEHCGKRVQQFPDGSTVEIPLLSVSALKSDYFERSDRRQIFIPQGRPAGLLELVDYYKFTKASYYNNISDQEHPKQSVILSDEITYDAQTQISHQPQAVSAGNVVPVVSIKNVENVGTGFILSLDQSRTFRLEESMELSAEDIPEITPVAASGVVAEVVQHPSKKSVFGLKNFSKESWFLSTQNGVDVVDTGRSIILKHGTKFRMGSIDAEIFENPFLMSISDGRIIVLNEGRTLTGTDIYSLSPASSKSNHVAKVVVSPHDNNVLGLKNLSTEQWKAKRSSGEAGTVASNRSIILEEGLTIEFGRTQGQVLV